MLQENISIHDSLQMAHSEALKLGDFIYISGILPLDENNRLAGDDIEMQTEQVLKNLGALLKQCGLEYKHVMRLGIQLTDLDALPYVDKALRRVFTEPFPACTVTGVNALLHHARVQMDGIAIDTRALEVLCDGEEECCDDKCCGLH